MHVCFFSRLQDVVLHLTNSQHPGTPQGLNLVVKVNFLIEACIIILAPGGEPGDLVVPDPE